MIVALSDTHGKHRNCVIPNCDIVIHCGDICNNGDEKEILDFFEWFSALPAKKRLFVSGNHDYPFVFEPKAARHIVPKNVILLENKCINVFGLTIYGIKSQENLFEMPEIINKPIDILLSHVPPKGILDDGIGCPILLDFVQYQKPLYHFFGHAHKYNSLSLKVDIVKFFNVT